MKIVYPARFDADEDRRVVVTFRDLLEAATDAADMDEASAEAVDVLDSALMFRMKYRENVPAPSKPRRGERLVVPDTGVAMKIALYIAMGERGMTAAELTARLGVDNRETQRILNPHHATRIARMSETIAATGRPDGDRAGERGRGRGGRVSLACAGGRARNGSRSDILVRKTKINRL